MTCPIELPEGLCECCVYSKEGLCDYPYKVTTPKQQEDK
jgi:hypothetical protein